MHVVAMGWQLFKHEAVVWRAVYRLCARGVLCVCMLPRYTYAGGKTVIYHLPFEISESIYLLDSFFFPRIPLAPPTHSTVLRWHRMRWPMNQLHICCDPFCSSCTLYTLFQIEITTEVIKMCALSNVSISLAPTVRAARPTVTI